MAAMTAIVKVQRDGTVIIPPEWRSPDFEDGKEVEAIRTSDGILLHPVTASGIRQPSKPGGWRAILETPGLPHDVIVEINRVVEEGCEQIDPDEWK